MKSILSDRSRWNPDPWLLMSLAAGIALFFTRFGMSVLDPGSVDWLLARYDPASYYLIWDFFRFEPWSFPLGAVSGYLYPLGSALPLADGLPLLAFPLKVLSPLLPRTFQYYGFWLLVCYSLQAYFGYRISRRFTGRGVVAVAGAILFLVMPTFMFRQGHIALSSHWTLLAALCLYLEHGSTTARVRLKSWYALLALIALIHPYLTAMAFVFFVAAYLRPGDGEKISRRILIIGGGFLVTALFWWVAGYFVGMGGGGAGAGGFGEYSMNLSGIFNPNSFSNFLKSHPIMTGQYEGFAYLGIGWLVLLLAGVCALPLFSAGGNWFRRHAILAVALAGCIVFALSNIVAYGDSVILSYTMPSVLKPLTEIFRSSGRFVWPVIYAGCAFLLAVLARSTPRRALAVLLVMAAALQVADQTGMVFDKDHFDALAFDSRLDSPDWNTAAAASNCVTTIPPFLYTTQEYADFREFCFLASSNGLPTTAGYAGRVPRVLADSLADSLAAAIAAGTADPRNLYIVEKSRFPEVFSGLADSCRGSRMDGYHICYARDVELSQPPLFAGVEKIGLPEFLAANQNRTLLLTARDEMTEHLTAADRTALAALGVSVDSIGYRSSFAALIHRGKCIWQQIEGEAEIRKSIPAGETLGGFTSARDLELISAGYLVGNTAALVVDGRDECFGLRGLNVLVLDSDQRLYSVATFDTHKGLPGIAIRYRDGI